MAIRMPNIVERVNRLHLEPSMNWDEGDLNPEPDPLFYDALTHIFLPKQVPGQQQHNLEDIEHFLVQIFTNSFKTILTEVPMPLLQSILLMLQKWQTLQPTTATWNRSQFLVNFPKQVRELQEGHTIPIYVRNQNCTLLIKKHLKDKTISLSTFRPSLQSEIVMTNISGAHHMEIPETTETIQNTTMLESLSFANQLHELSTQDLDISLGKSSKGGNEYTATRDVADPKLVSDWIVGLLVPRKDSSENCKIKKKFRDQVSLNETKGSAKCLPFRRSGMYMALKGTLQLKLVENFDSNEQAKLVYKIILLRILTDMANQLPIGDSTRIDLASQILAKLGKRVQKLVSLSNLMDPTPATPLSGMVKTLKIKCLENVTSTVENLITKMNTIWDRISGCHRPNITLPCQYDEKDLHHQIPNLDNFIEKLKASLSISPLSINQAISGINESDVFPRYINAENILAMENSQLPVSSAHVWLYDTENFVKYHCNDENITIVQLSQILYLYFTKAASYYGGDPLGKSQIYLVSLKGLKILDKMTTKDYPLLLKYEPEVNINLFDHLLLPFKRDMDLLDNLLAYFKNRQEKAIQPGILSSNAITSSTFSVKYAQQNFAALRNEILSSTEASIQQKYVQVNNAIQTCAQLQSQIEALALQECICTFRTETYKYRREWRERQVKVVCQRCKLQVIKQTELRSCRQSISRYEKPLPVEEIFQWAVIFELRIPQQFSIYRDYLAHVKYSLWGEVVFNGGSSSRTIIWMEYSGLNCYKRENGAVAQKIKLNSPTMSSSSTYYTHTQNLDVMYNEKELFIINNGLGCNYIFTGTQDMRKPSIQVDCAFKLNTTSKHEAYSGSKLQVTLESTQHTQNTILARQVECHQNLGLDEFIAFGSLRSGHRIQMRNLYDAIYSGSLSVEEEPVLALILQTIWQLGKKNENVRETHLDFCGTDVQFAEEFLDMLDKLVKTNEANYGNALIVLVAVVITRRIADLNVSLQEKCYSLMKSWRSILSTWISKIETALDKPETALVHGEVHSLRKNLFEIVLCSMLSYSLVGNEDVSPVIKDQDDVVHWLQMLYRWNQFEDQPVQTSEFFKILQNFVKTIPLRLNLESKLSTGNSLIINALQTFISQRWNKTRECSFSTMSMPFGSRNKMSLLLVQYLETDQETGERITHQITLDFVRGRFLVNGYCQSTLPLEVKDHKLFRMYFKDATNLRIQRDNQVLTRTIVPFHNRHYEFHQTGQLLVIKESQEDCPLTKLILLDPQIFSGVLSAFFLDNYTHWLDTTKMCIYFRPNATMDDHSCHYNLQRIISNRNPVWILYDEKTCSNVLTIFSTGFQQVTKALERLELQDYINVTFQPRCGTATATLRRYNLRFTINWGISRKNERFLESVEYPGYSVCRNQYEIGTFIGLTEGLLLEKGEKRLILVPHSTIRYSGGLYHQNVSINLPETLQQPPCFVYEVDNVLKRLKAHNSKSAWLYLAALHAVTSSPFSPDPFTEVTGTEMAVNILQSACVWSCSPYDQESLSILNFIKELSPKRKWYGHIAPRANDHKGSMEITKWPQDLPSMVAYDGYSIIVDKLIEESEKLSMLYEQQDVKDDRQKTRENLSKRLRLRGYLRSLPAYNSVAALEYPCFFTSSQIALITLNSKEYSLPLRVSSSTLNISGLQTISFASLTKSVKFLRDHNIFKKSNLAAFLITNEPLDQTLPLILLDNYGAFQDLLSLKFRTNWLRLYTMATWCKTQEDFHLFGIILSVAAYRGASLEQLANLHCISLFATSFPNVPSYVTSSSAKSTYYSCPASNDYETSTICGILLRNAKPFTTLPCPVAPTQPSTYNHYGISEEDFQKRHQQYRINKQKYETDLSKYQTQKAAFEKQIETSCSSLNAHFKTTFWPCKSIPEEFLSELLERHNFKSALVVPEINQMLEIWHRNYIFKLFTDEVQAVLNKIWDILDTLEKNISFSSPIPLQNVFVTIYEEGANPSKKSSETLESYMDVSKAEKLEACEKIFKSGRLENLDNVQNFFLQRDHCAEIVQKIREISIQMLTGMLSSKILYRTGITPRLSPITILKHLARDRKLEGPNVFISYAGALGVLWTHLKRLNRCIGAQTETDLQRERDNPGHQNWSPKEHPDWLLLELELDIMIRPIQVDVANQMIKMPLNFNGVTQLNMGEGKTSVIVPILCSTLAQKNRQLCRVTVLSSMFKMNLNSLTFSIGGLLNKRVYSLPCRRDMKIDEECVNKIEKAYHECLDKEGVVLTLPEYRLSFRLLAYDKMYKKEWALGQKMLNVENFLRNYARDVLDESDELFSVKYQLVYTVGEQVPIDGGDLRWLCCQKILDIIPKVGEILFRKYGAGMVEFHDMLQKQNPHQFSTFRLLGNETCLKEFQTLVADSILSQVRISDKDHKILKRFLTDDQVDLGDHQYVMTKVFFNDNPDILHRILLYSGYLRRGVLGLALTKRWRVEYGVNPKPNFSRLMAIPFRAKDVAAEKTEFGHPDLAIILTHLSYYYSGLSNKQLQEVFDILKGKKSPDALYSQWISKIPKVPDFLERYYSLNMKDAHQRATLFEVLRRHKMVIDFWLSHCVFPRESKQFPGKLVMTAWDLCYERQRLPVSGFSGTNDSQVLLPLMITQQDLKQLENTNKNTTKTLLQPENGMNHKGFPMGVTCLQILQTMKTDNLTVLIDAGALMLECSNEQVANLWLKTDPNIEASVYFNENNELLVKTREDQKTGQDTPFEVSSYQGRLEKCGVFLDDQHTRGTDLKFPIGSKACVTVATRMKRDKFIQACMRMRKLGQGHSVTFYLSNEARDKIKGNEINTQGVLDWVCENTRLSNQDGLLHWALAGRNYAQRLAAEDHFHFPSHETPYEKMWEDSFLLKAKLEILANQCVDDEVVKLVDMYGQYTQLELLTELSQNWLNFTKRKLRLKEGEQRISPVVLRKLDRTREKIADKCLDLNQDKMILSSKLGNMMEEEQEKELELEIEVEVEEESEIERPPAAKPAIHHLHANVIKLLTKGGEIGVDGACFVKICQIFENTTFWNHVQPKCWKGDVFATKDFCSTIITYFHTDAYLRPVQFLISNKVSPLRVQWLAISPFEANELLPYFRSDKQTKFKLHMFSARRTEKQDLLLNNRRLQLPSATDLVKLAPSSDLTSLLLASGNLYFASMEEQKAYAAYLGIFPQPWSTNEKLAFEKGWITKTGFWLPHFRTLDQQIGFQEDPTGLVKKVLFCRHSSLSDVTHLMQLLNEKHYVEL